MIGRTSAQIGLFAFSAATLAGLTAGNTASTVISRALVAMFIAVFVGQFAVWCGRLIVRDHFLRRKLEIDRKHLSASGVGLEAGNVAGESAAEGG